MTTIITTVGTSFIGGCMRNKMDFSQTEDVLFEQMMQVDRVQAFSAEMASTHSLMKQYPNAASLHLLVSDTAEGYKIGALLQRYFETFVATVSVHVIDGLNGSAPETFRQQGLRNLVNVLLTILTEHDDCVLNATGGYKAQVAFAGIVGQVFHIPVLYQFEGFDDVIQLPTMPLRLNTALFAKFEQTFQCVASGQYVAEIPLELSEYIENINGESKLTAIGLCLYEYAKMNERGV
ncbi:putative CRISPR-associated protein [Caryophanon latum]|uniref:CRISPR system ring nuclease SSO1393-like domain-containing protein n=1 Tax=Caryophanon latum TaxID=33977 RepID=A0A1C0YV42_9BACL|nr:putative CRISPR-associated protein [Caryophanon latum]OCS91022.1 hypothetical protein A6K76_09765 [Caryophanon latum]